MLIFAGLMEPAWVYAVSKSEGGSKPIPLIIAFFILIMNFTLFSLALKNIKIDVAYIVWVGLGTCSITFLNYFNDGNISYSKLLFISFILTGVIGLRFSQ